MRNLIILILLVCAKLSAQPRFEFYTSYGYFKNTNTGEFLNIDGEHYYWYFNWELGDSIYNPKNEEGVAEFEVNGFFYRKDISRDITTKSNITRIRFVPDGKILKAFLYGDVSSSINHLILIKGEDGKSFYVEMCFKDENTNSNTCLKKVVHSSYPFEDDYYVSKLPSQN